MWFFFFQAEDGIRYLTVTGVQTCALPISLLDLVAVGVENPVEHRRRGAPRPLQHQRLVKADAGAPIRETAQQLGPQHRLVGGRIERSEEHTSELQSQSNLVCRLLLEKKKH